MDNKSRKWTFDECESELRYIEATANSKPYTAHNKSADCLAEYINMQANQFLHSGFLEMAFEALGWRDFVQPSFVADSKGKGKSYRQIASWRIANGAARTIVQ